MRYTRPILFIVLLVSAATLQAQATRTWVSGVGDDANPCSRTAPCKTFAGAISKTATGGEISVLDPGGFGAVTITKSIVIDGAGTQASILASGTSGIIINGVSTSKVTIRNVSINGAGTALTGIRILNAATVNIENVVIQNIGNQSTHHGVLIDNDVQAIEVNLTNVSIFNSFRHGISIEGNFEARVAMDGVRALDNGGSGLALTRNGKVTLLRSTLAQNSGAGLVLQPTCSAATCDVSIYESALSRNGDGISAQAGTVRLYGTQITQNTATGIFISGGATVGTHGNNAIAGNAGPQATNSVLNQQ